MDSDKANNSEHSAGPCSLSTVTAAGLVAKGIDNNSTAVHHHGEDESASTTTSGVAVEDVVAGRDVLIFSGGDSTPTKHKDRITTDDEKGLSSSFPLPSQENPTKAKEDGCKFEDATSNEEEQYGTTTSSSTGVVDQHPKLAGQEDPKNRSFDDNIDVSVGGSGGGGGGGGGVCGSPKTDTSLSPPTVISSQPQSHANQNTTDTGPSHFTNTTTANNNRHALDLLRHDHADDHDSGSTVSGLMGPTSSSSNSAESLPIAPNNNSFVQQQQQQQQQEQQKPSSTSNGDDYAVDIVTPLKQLLLQIGGTTLADLMYEKMKNDGFDLKTIASMRGLDVMAVYPDMMKPGDCFTLVQEAKRWVTPTLKQLLLEIGGTTLVDLVYQDMEELSYEVDDIAEMRGVDIGELFPQTKQKGYCFRLVQKAKEWVNNNYVQQLPQPPPKRRCINNLSASLVRDNRIDDGRRNDVESTQFPTKAKEESNTVLEVPDDDPCLLTIEEIWLGVILPFVGPGHFVFVAGVSRRLMELYKAYLAKLNEANLPLVRDRGLVDIPNHHYYNAHRKVPVSGPFTLSGAVFSSRSCAEFWYSVTRSTSQGFGGHLVTTLAARSGNATVLDWTQEKGFPWHPDACALAAEMGNLDILKYIRNKGCPWNEDVCERAAGFGHVEVLNYARQEGCPWNETTCAFAAKRGQLEALTYAHENGCPWDEKTCSNAAYGGQLVCLQYAHDNGCPWDDRTCRLAALKGSLEILRYAHEEGCPWNALTCKMSIEGGHLECLRYAHGNDCPLPEDACDIAAKFGRLECLEYCLENGCIWNEHTCAVAAAWGQLEILKYAHENDCPWDALVCAHAAGNGNMKCLQYARANGCPWDNRTCDYALRSGHLKCFQYARVNGCSFYAGWEALPAARFKYVDENFNAIID